MEEIERVIGEEGEEELEIDAVTAERGFGN
jgi:hypothetical protein